MRNIKKCLKHNGTLIIEIHYFLDLVNTVQYDTIYHEHMRYYTLQSLNYILNKHGFTIFDAVRIPTHGGSLRVYASLSKKLSQSKNLKKLIKIENKFLTIEKIQLFKKKIIDSKYGLIEIIKKIKIKNKKIYAVGAPSRASTLINYVGLDHNDLDYVLEIAGSSKINNYMPGTKIPIVNENIIKKRKPDYLLILSWHIYPQIIKVFKKIGYKGKYIIPLPTPRVI